MGRSVAFVYFDDPLWNAFALGGNKMVFFSGFTHAVDDDELAAVIGHEMAHNTASHISEQRASKLIVRPCRRRHRSCRLAGSVYAQG